MSHISTIRVQIKNLEAMERACDRLGLEFRRHKKNYNWWGVRVGCDPLPDGLTLEDLGKCEHAIAVEGSAWHDTADRNAPYEIGLVASKETLGIWTLAFDSWNGGHGLMALVGDECKTLMQMYALEVAREEAQVLVNDGWEMTEVKQKNGDIKLKLTQGAGAFGGAGSGWGN